MRKKKLKKIVIIVIIIFIVANRRNFINFIEDINFSAEYETIKEDKNENYSGIGQRKVKEEGYFTTFTTEEKYQKTYKEYKQNGDAPWSKNEYWGGIMEEEGCGITAMAIVLSGYGKDYTPEDLRKKYYPVLDYSKMSKELLSTYNIKNTDFYYDSVHLSKKSIIEHLSSNRPVLICVWDNPKENRWTKLSHYMVLLATDGDNKVYISNPNGEKNGYNSSGWYEFKEILPYIAKALYIESYE